MNQILLVKQVNQFHRRFFKIQFVISILMLIFLLCLSIQKWKKEQELQKVSQVINQVFELETVYETQRTTSAEKRQSNQYFGKIMIPKINLEYSVFNECNDELLQILPCKFYGPDINGKGNICIAGHNYNDNRFFGKLDKLNIANVIYLRDLKGKNYKYVVYDKYQVEANNFECLRPNKTYELTLITCDNRSHKRLIIKAEKY